MAELNEIAAGTMIGFSANKTVKEAKEDTATNRVDICKTKELYLNGERAGVTDVEKKFLEENLNTDSTVKASKVKTSLGSDIETYVKNNVAGAYKYGFNSMKVRLKHTQRIIDALNNHVSIP